MRNQIKTLLLLTLVASISAGAMAADITAVSIHSYSGRLSSSWDAPYSIDGNPATFWYSGLGTDAWIIYQFDAVYQVGDVSITMTDGNYRKLSKAAMSVSTDGVTFTPVGEFSVDVADAAVTTFTLGGVDAKYVRLDATEAYYSNWDPRYATLETASDGKYAISMQEIAFATAFQYADAGPDQELYDADDNAEEIITLDGSASSFPNGTITGYSWAEEGVEIATGVSPTVTLGVGEHTIVLTVTMSDGATDADVVMINIVGTPQSFASAGDDQIVIDSDDNGSEPVTLDGSHSAWSTATWEWREDQTVLGTGQTCQVTLAVGTHTVELHCTDMSGHNDMDTVIIDVRAGAQPPVADAGADRTVTDPNGSGDELVSLDGSASIDYDGTIVSYVWTENDVEIATGVNGQATFTLGDHTVTLTVTDNEGRTDTDTVLIRVIEYVPSPTDAPCVGAWEADNLFDRITAADMDIIRSKNVLLGSRSFGLNLRDGFTNLNNLDPMYHMDVAGGYDVWGGGVTAVPADVFDNANFVQYLSTHWPLTVRVDEMNTQVRDRFHDKIDAAIIFYHTCTAGTFSYYSTMMDTLRLDYPDIKFIYVTSGASPVAGAQANIDSNMFTDLVLANYQGQVPIYDMMSILSTYEDGERVATFEANGQTYRYMCPDFNINGDNTHPNAAFSETRMGKGMMVLLHKLFCETPKKPGDADGDNDVDLSDFVILKSHFGSGTTWEEGDFDGDGDVDLADFVILKTNFGK